jgi:3-deoxy-D-manno-octulosonic-acid transferase
MVKKLQAALAGRPVVLAGSTLAGEEAMLLKAWPTIVQAEPDDVLVMAPRHPERFAEVAGLIAAGQGVCRATGLGDAVIPGGEVLLLDTVGDLAAMYGLARVAFVGGSLVERGGHNPLEAARFGVPVVMGESYENFREIVEDMRAAKAIRIVDEAGLGPALLELMQGGRELGERGQVAYERQAGATARTITELLGLMGAAR